VGAQAVLPALLRGHPGRNRPASDRTEGDAVITAVSVAALILGAAGFILSLTEAKGSALACCVGAFVGVALLYSGVVGP
jgi:hypothetical protein